MMRTSTGSISVMRIIQKTTALPRKSKYTMAKADRMEMAILPTAEARATTALFQSNRPMCERRHASW